MSCLSVPTENVMLNGNGAIGEGEPPLRPEPVEQSESPIKRYYDRRAVEAVQINNDVQTRNALSQINDLIEEKRMKVFVAESRHGFEFWFYSDNFSFKPIEAGSYIVKYRDEYEVRVTVLSESVFKERYEARS
jgi:hypothetical protein